MWTLKKETCVWVVVPSYGGRIPSVVRDMFRNCKGNGTKAILSCGVWGNRAIDDTLLELQDVLEASGFIVYRRHGEAVAEHSLMHQFGTRTPGSAGRKGISLEFATKIKERSKYKGHLNSLETVPYREYGGVPLKTGRKRKCTSCDLCSQKNARQVLFPWTIKSWPIGISAFPVCTALGFCT